jgi:RNase H-fold protein (predicted Holliday junction resolvase)
MRHHIPNILGIDRGTKYVGLAYQQGDTGIILPIWYSMNDKDLMRQMGEFLTQYHVGQIVVGRPSHDRIQSQIKKFVTELALVAGPDTPIHYADENYSSVQAWERSGDFSKNAMEDTLAAMVILENFVKTQSD